MALLVNGELVADEDFYQEFLRQSSGAYAGPESMAQLRRAAERSVVHRVLLVQMARQHGISVSVAEVNAERQRQWRNENNSVCGSGIRKVLADGLLIEKLRDQLSRHVPRPSRASVEAYYRENPSMFWKPERVLVAHIIKNVERPADEPEAMAQLLQAQLELERGKSFAAVAERHSDCRGNGGSLGWVERGQMVEAFEQVVFGLKEQQRSPIFRSVFGLHIAQVEARKAAGVEPFEDVRIELARRLHQEQRQRVLDQALAAALSRAQIATAEPAENLG